MLHTWLLLGWIFRPLTFWEIKGCSTKPPKIHALFAGGSTATKHKGGGCAAGVPAPWARLRSRLSVCVCVCGKKRDVDILWMDEIHLMTPL